MVTAWIAGGLQRAMGAATLPQERFGAFCSGISKGPLAANHPRYRIWCRNREEGNRS